MLAEFKEKSKVSGGHVHYEYIILDRKEKNSSYIKNEDAVLYRVAVCDIKVRYGHS
jgi:hypothetical protein